MTTPPPPPSQGLPSNLRFSNPEVLDVKEDEDLEFEYLIEKGPKSAPLLSLTPECSFSEAGNIDLNEFVFSTPMREDVIHNVVVWQRAKRRRGLAKQKNRSEVSGSTRKPFPQKGTGRARQGSTRAPHMRGGAVALAARGNRDFSYKLNKKYVRLGLRSVLSARLYEGNLIVVDTLEPEVAAAPAPAADADESAGEVVVEAPTSRLSIRTKHVAAMLEDQDWGSALFVDTDERSEHFRLAVSNVPNAHVLPQIGLNVYDILSFEKIVIKREALEALYRRLDENIRKIYFSR
ncbi:50S ribosomal protein L4, chloroplastic [Hondaea fermentalgiana]|uniref:Large ribosomal subunit protein uL4m n=1 Tax=Hondaea fermentalgiana TaxID=2315210 RepID=A0A2R5GKG2_9STRA|nr:50S ribosomal protein L4, chloroplastic [Hondaea fermentalgiana]|eukprot:GBG31115.1 50S ribosomal protein L4, chloroplastic [Hondaea fermentalgiana]